MLHMDKAGLLELIAKINTTDEHVAVSTETAGWKARREAEALTDPALFPLLQKIIEEHDGKQKDQREIRNAAYFIFGRLMQASFEEGACAFFLRQLGAETDKYILSFMLDRVHDWWKRAGKTIPAGLDISNILTLAKDDRRSVRHSAIRALGACPREESRDMLRSYLLQEDEKAYQYEIYYANIAMQGIGEPEDIPFLERFLKSRRPDIKMTAQYAIQFIQERNHL